MSRTNHTPETLIAFEKRIVDRFNAGELPFLVHLSGGNETQMIRLFEEIKEGDWIFASHRCHYAALLAGIPDAELERKICDGDSMFVYSRERNFLTSAILAGNCAIAAGVAWQLKKEMSKNRVWCFLGDGAEEEGHFYEAVLFVEANDLHCTFVVEDNGRQVDTGIVERRGHDYVPREPLEMFGCVQRIIYEPTYPHAGRGPGPQVTFRPDIVAKHAKEMPR